MTRIATALVIGAIFGLGIAISGMANPAKVLNFFDVAGTWDPSLIFVMAGGLAVTAIGYRLVFRSRRPVFESGFVLPPSGPVDAPLIGGAALFGIGWGLSGFCPGGAVPALGLGEPQVALFLASMVVGMIIARLIRMRAFRLKAA